MGSTRLLVSVALMATAEATPRTASIAWDGLMMVLRFMLDWVYLGDIE